MALHLSLSSVLKHWICEQFTPLNSTDSILYTLQISNLTVSLNMKLLPGGKQGTTTVFWRLIFSVVAPFFKAFSELRFKYWIWGIRTLSLILKYHRDRECLAFENVDTLLLSLCKAPTEGDQFMCWTRCGEAWLFHKCVPLSGFGCRQFLNYSNDSRGQGQTEIHSYLSAGCIVTVNWDTL